MLRVSKIMYIFSRVIFSTQSSVQKLFSAETSEFFAFTRFPTFNCYKLQLSNINNNPFFTAPVEHTYLVNDSGFYGEFNGSIECHFISKK